MPCICYVDHSHIDFSSNVQIMIGNIDDDGIFYHDKVVDINYDVYSTFNRQILNSYTVQVRNMKPFKEFVGRSKKVSYDI